MLLRQPNAIRQTVRAKTTRVFIGLNGVLCRGPNNSGNVLILGRYGCTVEVRFATCLAEVCKGMTDVLLTGIGVGRRPSRAPGK